MTTPTTIQFNVGGTQYEVSKSLLEMFPDTMLASLASPRWHSDANDGEPPINPIFIDRNGERFQYVLDYMRDNGTVNLPIAVSPDAIITELEYFGFENVKSVAVFRVASPSTRTIVDMFARAKKNFEEKQQELNTINAEWYELERQHKQLSSRKSRCLELATKCFTEFRREASLAVTVELDGEPLAAVVEIVNDTVEWKEEFDSLLEGVGLKLLSVNAEGKSNYYRGQYQFSYMFYFGYLEK